MAPCIIAHFVRAWVCARESQRVESNAAGPRGLFRGSAHPGVPTSAAPSPSIRRSESVPLASAASALSECFGALSLIQVTVNSLEAQDVACAEQEVLTRAIQALWAVHDWIHGRMWSEIEAQRARERECQS